MKTSSRLTASPRSGSWNFSNCHFRRTCKSHRQPLKNKLIKFPTNGRHVISSLKERRQAGLHVSSGACELKHSLMGLRRNANAGAAKSQLFVLPLKINASRIMRTHVAVVALPKINQAG